MFFILSKIFAILIKPLNILGVLGLFALSGKNARRKKTALRCLVFGLLLFTNPAIISWLGGAWEIGRQSPADIQTPYDIGILLGGYTLSQANVPAGILALSRSDRLTATLQLYFQGKIKRILLSGGSAAIIGQTEAEAILVRRYLLQLGIPDTAIILEARSRNTRENALFSKEIIDREYPGARCLLISSAWHLPRAGRCFAKVGQPCALFGIDFASEKTNGNPLALLEPDGKAIGKWEYLIKEWIGYLVYRFKGYI